jgi:ArsR family transcriptional regulator
MSNLTEFFKLASDENRLRIIVLLAQEDLYVCQICGILHLPQPTVSKHLAKLRDLHYVVDERNEKFIRYSLRIEDPVIRGIVREIARQVDRYPVLGKDRENLPQKASHLRDCKRK